MTGKTDKGLQLIYWKLSYRRKFLRTLWLLPTTLLFFLFPADITMLGLSRNLIIATVLFLYVVQAAYNYYKWKTEETDRTFS